MWRTPAYVLVAVALGIVLMSCGPVEEDQIPLAPRLTLFAIVLALGPFQFRFFADARAEGRNPAGRGQSEAI
jgi:hypothetical protein